VVFGKPFFWLAPEYFTGETLKLKLVCCCWGPDGSAQIYGLQQEIKENIPPIT